MNDNDILNSTKMDIGISGNAYDQRLKEYIKSAKMEIQREGVVLDDTTEDRDLVARYAAWMWKKRDTGEGIPRMIRWHLNNRIFSGRKS